MVCGAKTILWSSEETTDNNSSAGKIESRGNAERIQYVGPTTFTKANGFIYIHDEFGSHVTDFDISFCLFFSLKTQCCSFP